MRWRTESFNTLQVQHRTSKSLQPKTTDVCYITICMSLDSQYMQSLRYLRLYNDMLLKSASFHLRRVAGVTSQKTDCFLLPSLHPFLPFLPFSLCSVTCPARFCRSSKHRRHCAVCTTFSSVIRSVKTARPPRTTDATIVCDVSAKLLSRTLYYIHNCPTKYRCEKI